MSTNESQTATTGIEQQDVENEQPGDIGETIQRPEDVSLSLDHVFEILKNRRRREVIHYLREHEERVTLSDLAEHIAALENDTDVTSITSSQRKRVYVGLYQCHLPKMADMDIVDFNQDRGIVGIGENADQLYEYLDSEDDRDRNWYSYYLPIAGLGAVSLVASALVGAATPLLLATVAVMTVLIGCCATLDAMRRSDTSLRGTLRHAFDT
jgi:DNA-binding transcriptional ArsR family regulator